MKCIEVQMTVTVNNSYRNIPVSQAETLLIL